ncbi:putative gibberellin regulated protein [Dioscorea sansibarensis]
MSTSGVQSLLFCLLILFLFVQVFSKASLESEDVVDTAAITPKINCNFACAKRCMKASRQKVCTRACGSCCSRCQCVPAGTYGNKNSCPCYANLTTKGKKPKCP